MKFSIRKLLAVVTITAGVFSLGFAEAAENVQQISAHVSTTLGSFASIMQNVGLIAGICFILASLFKFHQHRQNPTQVPLSQAIVLLVIGACLIVFPYLIQTPSTAITNKGIATLSGNQIHGVIGGQSGNTLGPGATTPGGGNVTPGGGPDNSGGSGGSGTAMSAQLAS